MGAGQGGARGARREARGRVSADSPSTSASTQRGATLPIAAMSTHRLGGEGEESKAGWWLAQPHRSSRGAGPGGGAALAPGSALGKGGGEDGGRGSSLQRAVGGLQLGELGQAQLLGVDRVGWLGWLWQSVVRGACKSEGEGERKEEK